MTEEVRTTECKEAGHRELVLRFDDADDAPLVAKWAETLTLRIFDGQRFASGDRVVLFGTRFLVEDEGELLALHEDDLTSPDDAVRFVPGVGRSASWIRSGIELAESYGTTWRAFDLRYGTLAMCPEVHASANFSTLAEMARTNPPDGVDWMFEWLERRSDVQPRPFASGWYLACGVECTGRGSDGVWTPLRFVELATARPTLARFLWLEVGTIVEQPFLRRERLARLRPEVPRDDPWNVLRVPADIAIKMAIETDGLKLRPESPEAKRREGSFALDPSRDGWILDEHSSLRVVQMLSRRFGIAEDAATRILVESLGDDRLVDWLMLDPRVTISREQLDPLVRRLLAAPAEPRWTAHNELARQLHNETSAPFSQAKETIVSLDRALSHLLNLRRVR